MPRFSSSSSSRSHGRTRGRCIAQSSRGHADRHDIRPRNSRSWSRQRIEAAKRYHESPPATGRSRYCCKDSRTVEQSQSRSRSPAKERHGFRPQSSESWSHQRVEEANRNHEPPPANSKSRHCCNDSRTRGQSQSRLKSPPKVGGLAEESRRYQRSCSKSNSTSKERCVPASRTRNAKSIPAKGNDETSVEIEDSVRRANGDPTWQACIHIKGVGGRTRTVRGPPRPEHAVAVKDGDEMKECFVSGGIEELRKLQQIHRKQRVT